MMFFKTVSKKTSFRYYAINVVTSLFVEVLHQIVYPLIVVNFAKYFDVEVQKVAFSAPNGPFWMYYGVEGFELCGITGWVWYWAAQWMW